MRKASCGPIATAIGIPLIETGVTTLARVRGFLRSEGATDEQLAELDARLTSAIERRKAEHDGA